MGDLVDEGVLLVVAGEGVAFADFLDPEAGEGDEDDAGAAAGLAADAPLPPTPK